MDSLFITIIILSLISLSLIIVSLPLISRNDGWGTLTLIGVVGLAFVLGFGLANVACKPKSIIISTIQPSDVLKSKTTKYLEFDINDKIYKFSYSDKSHYDNDSLEFYYIKYYDYYGDNIIDSIIRSDFYKNIAKDTVLLYNEIPKKSNIKFQKNL